MLSAAPPARIYTEGWGWHPKQSPLGCMRERWMHRPHLGRLVVAALACPNRSATRSKRIPRIHHLTPAGGGIVVYWA
ncbi:uncharacterized protein METZ01_LOCUS246673, partial [marine metagenome]